MKEILPAIEFTAPWFFWLLLALPLFWLRIRSRNAGIIIWRALIVILLVLILANPQSVSEHSSEEERIFAFDMSRSIPPGMQRWMADSTRREFSPNKADRIFVFGAETRETNDWAGLLAENGSRPSGLRPEKTNLENLVKSLVSLPGAPRKLFLFTDGWETEGNVERVIPAAVGAGLKVFPLLPAQQPKIPNVAVLKLLAPTHGNSGEAVNLKVVLENQNDRLAKGTLTITRNGQPFKTQRVELNPGSRMFTYQSPLPEDSTVSYRATFVPLERDFDRYTSDNQATAWVTIKTKAKLLLVNGSAAAGRYLEEILKRRGYDVTVSRPGTAPSLAGYKAVIFNNVSQEAFSPTYLSAVERHVADGNGFLLIGSEASFSPASYRGTPIESLLPLEPKEPKREEKNRAVVLLIDKSGSMRENSRILYAVEAAKAVARQLKDNDLLAVIGFDVSPFVVVSMETVGRLRRSVDAQIERLKPGGQTYFFPALLEAKRQIERANVGKRHIILLSDGETRGSQGELIDLIEVMKREMKITVSSVAIGTEADVRIMKRISQYGGGLFHHTIDPRTLPQIVLQQLQDEPKDQPQSVMSLVPARDRGSELLAGLSLRSYPAVLGYMETELKRGATQDLYLSREDRRAPLLASWRYDKGKAAAFTTDLEGRWSRNWIQWSGMETFWSKVIDWLRPGDEPIPLHEVRISAPRNQPLIDLYLYDERSANNQFGFTVSGKNLKSEGKLRRLAFGHYQAALPAAGPGDYRIEISAERQGRTIVLPPAVYTLHAEPDSEQPRAEFNIALLAKLAQATGGEINPRSVESLQRQTVSKKYWPLRRYFIALAAILFLLEIAYRKIALSES